MLLIKNLYKKYPAAKDFALHNISLEIEAGQLIALTGESGCGKTTLLRLVAGLEMPVEGSISIAGQVVADRDRWVKPEQRKVGMVFQDYALFPHLTVAQNVVYGLTRAAGRQSRMNEVLRLVGLSGYEQRYPHELSGGQQQRVALARALAPQPAVLLLDEPFSNLDEMLREQLRDELCQIIRAAGTTAMLVTHDTKDALTTADKIVLLRKGHLLQFETPQQLYDAPADEYTAGFFGKANLIEGKPVIQGLQTTLGLFHTDPQGKTKVCIRPENILISDLNTSALKARVLRTKFFGSHQEINLQIGQTKLVARMNSRIAAREGEMVGIHIDHYHVI